MRMNKNILNDLFFLRVWAWAPSVTVRSEQIYVEPDVRYSSVHAYVLEINGRRQNALRFYIPQNGLKQLYQRVNQANRWRRPPEEPELRGRGRFWFHCQSDWIMSSNAADIMGCLVSGGSCV